ncbi:Tetratricopeptide repeat-containing protein [Maridesulfovibrio ferrireducens]|uniref:Tetratricopeptide repeat-containing protein n=1 Tax=Maridesulfovibrio ferrireducens TaxID=246191 RepID=A0A1G9EDT1_9BACT|nr:tetratricopeptide repeat protein [Maridesulfovibrio ferrireducens]SDK74307.1 Tetratricopeptide repeat-containing protein [Maridesulfovibrio ferrireducens]
MTSKKQTNPVGRSFALGGGQKFVVILLGVALLVIFVSSLTYRMNHPGNKVEFQQQKESSSSGMSQEAMGESMKEIRKLMDLMRDNPEDMKVQLELANAFMMIRAYDRAQTFFEKVVENEPANINALMGLGMCYYQAEKFDKAAEAFDKILLVDPDDSMAHFNTGIIKKYYLHAHEEAEEHFKKIIANPKSSDDMRSHAEEELKKEAHED